MLMAVDWLSFWCQELVEFENSGIFPRLGEDEGSTVFPRFILSGEIQLQIVHFVV